MAAIALRMILPILAFVLVSSCGTLPEAEKTPVGILRERAEVATETGGAAAVGVGTAITRHMALDKARIRGRAELTRLMEIKLDSIKTSFLKKAGDVEGDELDRLFSEVTSDLSRLILRTATPIDSVFESGEGMTTARVLMVLDPADIVDAFAARSTVARHLYSRFVTSDTFAGLEEQIKRFKEFSRGGDSEVISGE